MQEFKKFAFDVGITLFASIITISLGFVIILILGRYLGAGDLGLYRMTFTIYGIALLIAGIGIQATMIKYVAEYKKDRNKFNQIVSSGVITSLFFGIGFIALFHFSSGSFADIFNMPRLSHLIKILSLAFPFALVGGVLLGLLNGLREMKKYATAVIIQSVSMTIITLALVYYGFGVASAVIGVVFASVVYCLFLIYVTRNYFEITFSNYIQTTKRILKFSSQIFGANAINMINYQADIVLIGYFLTFTDVGYYTVAVGLSKFLWIFPQAIQTIAYPTTSEYWAKNNHSTLQTMVNKSMKYTACILLPLGLGVGFFATGIVTMIFGKAFFYSVLPLQILIVGTVIFGIAFKSIGGALPGANRPDLSLKTTCAGAIINIILNVSLIPYFGIVGAAIATAASLITMAFIFVGLTIKTLLVNVDTKWFAQITGITLIAIFSFVVGNGFVNIYILGFSILIVFIILIFGFFLTNEDRPLLKSLIYSLKIR